MGNASVERVGQREQARVWESLRTPHFHVRISGPTIPGPQVGWVVIIPEWSLWEKNKNGVEVGAGARTTHNGAGVDVITPRRAALHLQLDAGMIICTDPASHPRCPSSYWGPGISATQLEPGAQPLPPSPPERPAEKGQPAGLTHRAGSLGDGSF